MRPGTRETKKQLRGPGGRYGLEIGTFYTMMRKVAAVARAGN